MQDLTEILAEWPYDEDQNVRIVVADDGRSVLQVRLPLGIEQYELTGRPDGREPGGYTTVLEAIEDDLKEHVFSHGTDAGFRITDTNASALQGEAILFYYRYLLLFQLHRYDGVVQDTEHNLHVCDILERYCEDEDARNSVLQFRPYIIRINAVARARAIQEGLMDGDPIAVLDEAVQTIKGLEEIESPAFQFEVVRSTNYLRSLMRSMTSAAESESGATPASTDSLEQELREAIEAEDYERAARIRDTLRNGGDFGRVDKDQ